MLGISIPRGSRIVEIPKSYGNSCEKVLQELDEKFGNKIIIIKTEKI